jgi:pimeloyl-ACP methyl ester carboxylesterase
MKPTTFAILLIGILLIGACNKSGPNSSMHSVSRSKESYVESGKVKLHYLDWGGKGQVLVLICGLGDTPYLFENLAGALSDRFHVIGYWRRSHGKSKATDEKYDNATLVADLKLLLDSLKIDTASLLGWSMAGNEISEFATRYPGRVNKLIYFESGYDLSDGGFRELLNHIPKPFLPDSSVMKSLDSYREWYHHFWFGDMAWNETLEANLLASVHVNDDGSIVSIPDNRVFNLILTEAMNYPRKYDRVKAPSLVIYTKPFLHPADDHPVTLELYDNIERNIVAPWRSTNKKRIAEELEKAVIVDAPNGSHTSFLFLSHDFLVKTISSFLEQGSE